MINFEIILKGWDGSTDATDHLVKWVRAESKATLLQWLTAIEIDIDMLHSPPTEHEQQGPLGFEDGIDVILSPVMPDVGMSCSCQNYGNFIQITKESFDPQVWKGK